jgi:co-chaperonin GroES (HSP10)
MQRRGDSPVGDLCRMAADVGAVTWGLALFGKWSGSEVKIDGQDLLIMKESDIMG